MDTANPSLKPQTDTRPAVIFGCSIFAILATVVGFSIYFISKQFSDKTRAQNTFVNEMTSQILERHFEKGKEAATSFYFRTKAGSDRGPTETLKTPTIRAITIYPKAQTHIHFLRDSHDPDYLSENELSEMDHRFPIVFTRLKTDESELSSIPLKSGIQILRLLTRLDVPGSPATAIDFDEVEIAALLAPTPSMQAYLFNSSSKIILHSDVNAGLLKEDNSHLTAISKIRASNDNPESGAFDFRELPGRPLQYAAFQRLDLGGTTLVTQTSSTPLQKLLTKYIALSGALAIFWAFLFSTLFHHLFLKRKWGTLMLAAANAPPVTETDTVDTKKKKPFAPTRPKKFNSVIILSAQLEGLDEAIIASEAKTIAKLTTSLFEAIAEILTENHAKSFWRLGNSVVAMWGIPNATEGDMELALDAAAQLKQPAEDFKAALIKKGLPPVSLRLGIHAGEVMGGPTGPIQSSTHPWMGEGLELAQRIPYFSSEFSSDLLISERASFLMKDPSCLRQITDGDPSMFSLFEIQPPQPQPEAQPQNQNDEPEISAAPPEEDSEPAPPSHLAKADE